MIPTTAKSITLAPYQVMPVTVSGKVFSCSATSNSFLLSIDGGEYFPMRQGWTIDYRPDTFNTLTLYNNTATQVAATFYVGASAMFYSPPNTVAIVTNAPTYAKGSGIMALPGYGEQTYSGLDGANVRKQMIVCNMDAGGAMICIRDAAESIFMPIMAGESKTFECSGLLKLLNPNGGAVNVVVGEIFYA
jgi:hypothetical protein